MKIRTNYDTYYWTAVDDDTYDGAPDSHCPIGIGKTKQEAINDLLEQLDELDNDEDRWLFETAPGA